MGPVGNCTGLTPRTLPAYVSVVLSLRALWACVLDSPVFVAGLLFAGSERDNWAEPVLAAPAQASGLRALGSPAAEAAATSLGSLASGWVSRQSASGPFIHSRCRERSLQIRPRTELPP